MIGDPSKHLRADVGEGLKRLGLPRLILEGYPSLGLLANLANRHETCVTKVLFQAHAAELVLCFVCERLSRGQGPLNALITPHHIIKQQKEEEVLR
jgi:hypothetical protein